MNKYYLHTHTHTHKDLSKIVIRNGVGETNYKDEMILAKNTLVLIQLNILFFKINFSFSVQNQTLLYLRAFKLIYSNPNNNSNKFTFEKNQYGCLLNLDKYIYI